MKQFLYLSVMLLALFLWEPGSCYAQNKAAKTNSPDSTNFVVRRVNFKGNKHISSSTLSGLVQTHTNRQFFGIPGFTPLYFLYKFTGSFGEKPSLLNYKTVTGDVQRIERYYHSKGFLKASADSSFYMHGKKVNVTFNIKEGPRTFIRSVAYSGVPDSAFKTHRDKIDFYKNSPLTGQKINDSTFKAHLPYDETQLNTERNRIITELKNNGYAAVKRDSISALIKRRKENKHLLDVLYLVRPGKLYTFGDISIKLAGPGADTLHHYSQKDTLSGKPYTLQNQKIYLEKEPAAQTDFSLLKNQLLFKPGDTFSYKRYISTVNGFQNLGMMSILQFGISQNDSTKFTGSTIPVHFKLQTLPKNSISLNLNGIKRYGFGTGAGLTYTNNNLFGNAENLKLGINGSFEYVGERRFKDLPSAVQVSNGGIKAKSTFFKSFGANIDYSLPRLTFPFLWLNNKLAFANSRTHYSLNYNKSDQLLFDINGKITFNQRYVVKHNKRFTSFLDFPQLELLDTDPTSQFVDALKKQFEDSTGNINQPLALQQILQDLSPQFTSTIRYTFRSERTDLIERNYGYFSEYSIGVGGNIPYLLDRFAVTPDTLEGNLPSPVKVSANSLEYSQFIKTTADYRRYFPLSKNTVFAVRGFGGFAYPFGVNRTIPLDERFYAGGSNDIRGWNPFSLGPGSIEDPVINGGEIKLLNQVELRQTVLKNFLSTNWILAFFTDAGNEWYGPNINVNDLGSDLINNPNQSNINFDDGQFKFDRFYKQIAIGSGAGLRLDFNFLIARFDFAFRIHDLQRGYFNNDRVYFHFGIGQSF